MSGNFASLLPENQTEGLGGKVTVKTLRAATFDWNGKGKPTPVLALTFTKGDREKTEYITAGKLEFIQPLADGLNFTKALNKKSAAGIFIASAVAKGFPANRLAEKGLAAFDGAVLVIDREKTGRTSESGKEGERWIVTGVEGVSTAASTNGNGNGFDAAAAALSYVKQVLIANGGRYSAVGMAGAVYALMAQDPNKNLILPMLTVENYSKAPGIIYDSGAGQLILQ